MLIPTSKWKSFIVGCAFTAIHTTSHAVDAISFELGDGEKTKLARLGVQWKWTKQWWRSNGTHIGGYWDLSLAHWRGDQFQNMPNATQRINAVGITPVLRLQKNNLKGFYAEIGIGAHLLSDLYDNGGRRLSTRFQFGDHLGAGYVFPSDLDIGLRFQHFSNGSIKKPNDGVNFAIVRLSYPI